MALIPAFAPDCVVSLGVGPAEQKQWVASGFLYGKFLGTTEDGQNQYRIYLVSNRHVLDGHTNIRVRFNPQGDAPAQDYGLHLQSEDGAALWFAHPDSDVDVGVAPIDAPALEKNLIQFSIFRSDQHVANRAMMRDHGMSEGDGVFVLGFPMGLVGEHRNAVIVRAGCIARVRDCLDGVDSEYLVDATVFPGNSGGPVLSRPQPVAIEGTESQHAAYLIGVVKSYVPYTDVAVSAQTQQARVIFQENSGLSAVVPVDAIEEAIEEAVRVHPNLAVAEPPPADGAAPEAKTTPEAEVGG